MAHLVDQYGRPIETAALKKELAGPTLVGVRQPIGGHPAQGLTPQRLARILREAEEGDPTRYLELAEEMEEKEPHYFAVMQTRKRQVSQLTITVEPASDAAPDVANAALVQEFIDRGELEDDLFDILDAVGKGFSVTEIVWDMSGRQWMPQRLEWRHPQWFEFDREGGTRILRREPAGPVELEPFKFICHKAHAKSGLPIRSGLARVAAWAYLFKNYAVKDWMQFVEVYGQPLRVGRYPPSASADDRSVLLSAVAAIGADAAAIIPEGMTIEFVKDATGRQTSEIYRELAEYLDSAISKAVLGQTLTTQEGDSGSFALGQVHDAVRADIERSDARQLAATLNRDLVRPIVDLNRGPQAAYPAIRIGRDEQADVPKLAEALAKLVPLGLRVRQGEVRAKLGLEEPEDGDELLAPSASSPEDARDAAKKASSPEDARDAADEASSPEDARDAAGEVAATAAAAGSPPGPADLLADTLGDAAQPEMRRLVEQIGVMVDRAGSLEELREMLLAAFPRLSHDGLGRALEQGLAAAAAAGRFDAAGA